MEKIYDSTTLAAGDLALEDDDVVVFLVPAPLLAVLGAIVPTAAEVRAAFHSLSIKYQVFSRGDSINNGQSRSTFTGC